MIRTHSTVVLCALLAGCASNPETTGPAGPALEKLAPEEIKAAGKSLLQQQSFDERDQITLMRRLEVFLGEKGPQTLMAQRGVTAVIAYTAGSGGFIVKGGSGKGLVHFKGGAAARPIALSGYSVGAVVGGGASRGLAVVFGLPEARLLSGKYNMRSVDAKVGASGVSSGIANYATEGGHQVRFFSTGTGMSADAGIGSFSIAYPE